MIYKVDKSIFRKLEDNLPFLNYSKAYFVLLEESFFSENGKQENPWIDPENVIIYRRTSELTLTGNSENRNLNFEEFEKLCNEFFELKTKTLSNTKRYVMIGSRRFLELTEIDNPVVLFYFLEKANLKPYLEPSRYVVRIPCGDYNLDIVKFVKGEDLYVELTKNFSDARNQGIESLQRNLGLSEELKTDWANLYLKS